MVCIYTPSEDDRAIRQANYNTFTRRSLDGGANWSPARNLSGITNLDRSAFAPRIIGTPATIPSGDPADVQNPDVVYFGWDLRENAVEMQAGFRFAVFAAVSDDRGSTFSVPVPVADGIGQEFELGPQTVPDGSRLCTIWKQRDPDLNPETWFRCGNLATLPITVPANSTWSLVLLMLTLLAIGARVSRRWKAGGAAGRN